MKTTITLEIIAAPNGAKVVLQPEWRAKAAAAQLRATAQTTTEETVRAEILATADAIEEQNRRTREDYAQFLKVQEYPATPYTYGERIEAERRATEWVNKEPRFDEQKFRLCLLSSSLRMTEAEVLSESPLVVNALWIALHELSEPSLDRLNFFDFKPTGSE